MTSVMARRRCTGCSRPLSAAARFCPRCGRPADAPDQPQTLPSSSRIPLAGILFLVAAVLGPALIVVGAYTHLPFLLYAGIAVGLCLIVLLVLGLFF